MNQKTALYLYGSCLLLVLFVMRVIGQEKTSPPADVSGVPPYLMKNEEYERNSPSKSGLQLAGLNLNSVTVTTGNGFSPLVTQESKRSFDPLQVSSKPLPAPHAFGRENDLVTERTPKTAPGSTVCVGSAIGAAPMNAGVAVCQTGADSPTLCATASMPLISGSMCQNGKSSLCFGTGPNVPPVFSSRIGLCFGYDSTKSDFSFSPTLEMSGGAGFVVNTSITFPSLFEW